MRARDWMTHEVRVCGPETSMNEAAHLMWAHDCGVLPVVDGEGRVVGMITDRDLCMGACLQGRTLAELKVADAMARTVFCCKPADTIEQVVRRMADHQVRRVPVVDARGVLVGILSLNDLARRLVSLQDAEVRARLTPRVVEALATICEPRAGGSVPELVPAQRASPRPSLVG